jgi:hypothetical protein
MECTDVVTDCFGVTLGYQGAGAFDPYTDKFITMFQTSAGGAVTTNA